MIEPVDSELPLMLFEPDQALEAEQEVATPLTVQDNVFEVP